MPARYFYGWLKRCQENVSSSSNSLLRLSVLKDSALPQSAKDSGSKVPREEQTVSKPLQKALENPILWGWIQNLAVSEQNTGCKIKCIHPAVQYLEPGELSTGTSDTGLQSGQRFFICLGTLNLQAAEYISWCAMHPWGCESLCSSAGPVQKAYRMFISEEMLSGLQETDILFSNPFLLVKTAFVNDFLFKS